MTKTKHTATETKRERPAPSDPLAHKVEEARLSRILKPTIGRIVIVSIKGQGANERHLSSEELQQAPAIVQSALANGLRINCCIMSDLDERAAPTNAHSVPHESEALAEGADYVGLMWRWPEKASGSL